MSKLIVLEGLDGAGKSTQVGLLRHYLDQQSINSRYLHFPRTDNPYYGELIARFLRGDFGSMDMVHPYLAAVLYAGDRYDAKALINSWLNEGHYVILDRYFYSNVAYQCAKLESEKDKVYFRRWIKSFEFDYHQIPRPHITILLHVPFFVIQTRLQSTRRGHDRDYLAGAIDIHEKSISLQKKVFEEYLYLSGVEADMVKIDCFKENAILPPEQIHQKIIYLLQDRKLID